MGFRYENEDAVLRAEDWVEGDTLATFCSSVVSGTPSDPLTKPTEPRASIRLLATANLARGGWQNLLAAKAAATLANSPNGGTLPALASYLTRWRHKAAVTLSEVQLEALELHWAMSVAELQALWTQLDTYEDHPSVWVMEEAAWAGKRTAKQLQDMSRDLRAGRRKGWDSFVALLREVS